MIDSRQLRYFTAVAEELHFGRAAARLHIAQPALSRQIQQIERQLDATLFTRTQRRVALTPAGWLLLERSQQILEALQKAEHDTRRAGRGEIGRITLGFLHSSTYGLLPGILQRFRNLYPDIDLDLREMHMHEQAEALAKGAIDLALTRPVRFAAGIASQTVLHEPFVVAVPARNELATVSSIRLARLAQERFVMFPQSTSPLFHRSILRMCEAAGFTPLVEQTATQVHTVIGLVSAAMGVAIVPATARNLQISGVAFLRIEDEPPPVSIVLAWQSERDHATLQAFRSVALQAARQLPGTLPASSGTSDAPLPQARRHPAKIVDSA